MTMLSPVDMAFFLLETEQRPMNIGALILLVPPKSSRGRYADRLVRAMLKVPVGPPFNYRFRKSSTTGLPSLEPAPTSAAEQVFRHRVAPGDDLAQLFKRICQIHVEPLDRDQPLWEAHVFEGLPQGRVALYFKTHHGLIDGIGFIKIVLGIVSHSPRSRTPQAIWRGLPGATPGGARHSQGTVSRLAGYAQEARHTANDMLRLMWHQGLRDLGLGRGLAAPFVTTPDVLKTEPTAHRILAHCTVRLPRVRKIADRQGAKINDVMLAILDAAMNRYLAERGTPPDRPLVADVPVALEDHGGTGNRITILQVPMGKPGAGPAERLQDVVRETREMKGELRSISGNTLMLYSIVQHSIASAIESLGLGALPMLANTVISNPAGLEERAYFNGAAVELALPVSVVAHHQVLNITVTTYVDELHLTFIALREAIPDLPKLADYTVAALDALERDTLRPGRRKQARRKAA
jgi:diacylglycerol O-acyltransferase